MHRGPLAALGRKVVEVGKRQDYCTDSQTRLRSVGRPLAYGRGSACAFRAATVRERSVKACRIHNTRLGGRCFSRSFDIDDGLPDRHPTECPKLRPAALHKRNRLDRGFLDGFEDPLGLSIGSQSCSRHD